MTGRTARGERKRRPDFIVEEDDRDALDLDDDHAPRFKEKHSLDSDEEDAADDKTYEVLHEDDIEGQEDATVDFDEGIQITPFNMKEEMEEGHFDKTGNFIFDKNVGQVQDHWMDNIDWIKVKQKVNDDKADDKSSDDDIDEDVNTDDLYKQVVKIIKPGETIARALRRLGGGNKSMMSASQRLKAKKQKLADGGSSDTAENEQNKEAFLKLTGLADQLLSTGLMEIYESTYEKIMYTMNQNKDSGESAGAAPRIPLAGGIDDDDALDMFADDLKSKPSADICSGGGKNDQPVSTTEDANKAEEVDFLSDRVQWEYREKDEDGTEIHGPFSTSQMLVWQEESRFPDGVYCRKADTVGPFYNSKRMDFDLYT